MSNDLPPVTRPALRYHGGKWRLAPFVLAHCPAHVCYTEVYGGGGSVLLRKPRSFSEVYNDLSRDVVNFFQVLRNPRTATELRALLLLTPYAREEFDAAYAPADDAVEQARRLVVRSFMGFGSAACNAEHRTGFRSSSTRGQAKHDPAADWTSYTEGLPALTDRLRGVIIENRPALEILARYDTPNTLHYVDPPYPLATRSSSAKRNNCYTHELTDDDHRELAQRLHSLTGMVVVSGYACELYDCELFADWERKTAPALADGTRERTEVLWLNPAASRALDKGCKPVYFTPDFFRAQ